MVQSKPQKRYQANYSNLVHQFAFVPSEHFYPIRKFNDDWILKLRPKMKGPTENLFVFVYALTDDFSGYRLSRYFVSPVNIVSAITFLEWAWSKETDHAPFHGHPRILFMGNNDIANNYIFKTFCQRAEIQILMPGDKD